MAIKKSYLGQLTWISAQRFPYTGVKQAPDGKAPGTALKEGFL